MATSRTPAIIIVGAGRGSRFEGAGHKLAQTLGDRSVLERTIAHALATGLPLKVVITEPLAGLVGQMVATRDLVIVPEAQPDGNLGMGYSIARGVSASGTAAGWVILPADMPLIRPETITAVVDALREHPIAYAQYQGRRGHPVAFAAELYSDLVGLRGDQGARRLLQRYPAHALEVDDPGVLVDLDTEGDLRAMRERLMLA